MDKKIHKEVDDGFMTIIKIRSDIKTRIEDIEKIKHSIKQNYIECIEKESKNYFGLDSVHFQNKLIELEFANMLKLYNYIDNRIYGDYYKLFFMMNDYLSDKLLQEQYASIKEMKKKSLYPVYKDLDSFKSYDFDTINNIHQDVISIVKKVYEIHGENEEKIKTRQESLYYGINLDNYIINQQHLNQELLMTNNLHRNYICVYHKLHDNILDNFLEKVELFFEQINNHTNDESPKSTENVFQDNERTTQGKNEHDEQVTFSDESEEKLNNHNFVNDCESLFEIKEINIDTDKVDNSFNGESANEAQI